MRTDLEVPFADKDLARGLGARWDPARRVWYVADLTDLQPFLRWMPARYLPTTLPQRRARAHGMHAPRTTPRTDFSLPDCACASPPWERCAHTA